MRCQVVGKNITITDAMKKAIEEKLSKMDKYFVINNEDVVAKVLVRTYKTAQKIEVNIHTKMMDFRAEVAMEDFYASLDLAIDKLEGQMRKLKTKLCRRNKESLGESIAFENFEQEEKESENDQIVRVKEVILTPMDLEEAITRMEALGHNFFLYKDIEDEMISVVYKRYDGGYGVIQSKE